VKRIRVPLTTKSEWPWSPSKFGEKFPIGFAVISAKAEIQTRLNFLDSGSRVHRPLAGMTTEKESLGLCVLAR
jgi:hypothetical protein